jgi:hypothetical protein
VISILFLAIAIVMVAKSPVGLALADRIREGRRGAAGSDKRFDEFATQVSEDLTSLRDEVTDLAERMDFAERALLQLRRPDALPQSPAAGSPQRGV